MSSRSRPHRGLASSVIIFFFASIAVYYITKTATLTHLDNASTTKPINTIQQTERASSQRSTLGKTKGLQQNNSVLHQNEFELIYSGAKWRKYHGKSSSGSGSFPENTKGYRKFLENLFLRKDINVVLDAPCGVWMFAQLIDWSSIRTYIGIDIVKFTIEENKKTFSAKQFKKPTGPTFQFHVQSITDPNIPQADILICKDLLIHIPFSTIYEILRNVLPPNYDKKSEVSPKTSNKCKYKYVLFVHSMNTRHNREIATVDGKHRPINLTAPPFGVQKPGNVYPCDKKECLLFNLTEPEWNCQW